MSPAAGNLDVASTEARSAESRPRVLVDRADTLGGLAIVRSLGMAGFHAVAMSDDPEALAFSSRYCGDRVLSPAPSSPGYPDWLDATIRRYDIDLVIPSESMLLAIRPEFERFASRLSCSRDAKTVYSAFSKYDLFARTALDHRPPTLLLDLDRGAVPTLGEIRELPLPCFLKLDGVHARNGQASRVEVFQDHEAVRDAVSRLASEYSRALIQGYVPGRGAAAALVRWNDTVLASMQYERLHEVPHTGGASSFRGVRAQPELERDALARAAVLRWNGPAMFEYRVDPASGRFYLMELNARFWGSLHLALVAGVDFPAILARAALGIPGSVNPVPRVVRSRITIPGEVQYVASVWRDRSLPALTRWGAVAQFFALGLSPSAHSDLLFGNDPVPYWRAARNYAAVLLSHRR